ncbi:tetratricopeptide repeat protein, partial [Planctomycetota bacterium]
SQAHFRLLDEPSRKTLRQTLGELHYLMAYAESTNAGQIRHKDQREELLKNALRHTKLSLETGNASAAVLLQQAAIKKELGFDVQVEWEHAAERLTSSGSAFERYVIAVQLIQNGEDSRAESVLAGLLEVQPEDSLGWFLLGNCHYVAERFVEAESCYGSSVALWPEFHASYLHRGICRLKVGRLVEAGEDFTRVLDLRPNQTSALINRAIVHMKLGRYGRAENDLTDAITCGRTDSLVYILRSKVFAALGREGEAQSDLETAIKATPADVEGWIQRGLARLPNDPNAAVQDMDVAIELDPKSRKALQNKAHICSSFLKQDDKAIESLGQLLQLYPNDSTVLAARGLLYGRTGKRDLAIQDGRAALTLNQSASCFYQVARIFSQTSKRNTEDAVQAVRLLREAIRLDVGLAEMSTQDSDLTPISSRADFRDVLDASAMLLGNKTPSSAF